MSYFNRVAGLPVESTNYVKRITPIELLRRELAEIRELEEPFERKLSAATNDLREQDEVKAI